MDRPRIRPPYPPLASSSLSTPSHSSSSLASISSPNDMASRDQPSGPPAPQSAPLPSPSHDQRGFLFGTLNPPTSPMTAPPQHQSFAPQQQQMYSHASSSQPGPQPQAQAQQEHGSQAGQKQQDGSQQQSQAPQEIHTGFTYVPNRDNAGSTNPETAKMLHDYSLLAEAAKRAQVACMIRDLDAMDMS